MKNGFKVWDSDTHVEPSAEVIDKYLDPGFRNRLPELAQYRVPIRPGTPGSSPDRHVYRFGQISYKRILGEAAPRPRPTPAATRCGWGRSNRAPASRTTRRRTASPTWISKGSTRIS